MTDARVPEALAREIAASLRPVRPLPSPGRRTVVLAPLSLAVLAAVPLLFELREDAGTIGFALLWGASLGEIAIALAILSAAVAESIPGQLYSPPGIAARVLGATGIVLAITLTTYAVSPASLTASVSTTYFRFCFTHVLQLAVVPLTGVAILLSKGITTRLVVAGALAGFGSGLISDAGWRVFCHMSDPAHVLTAHVAAIATMTLIAGMAGAVLARMPGGR